MAKLVILNQGMIGRTFDLIAERTTVGLVIIGLIIYALKQAGPTK